MTAESAGDAETSDGPGRGGAGTTVDGVDVGRRDFVAAMSSVGVGSVLFPGVLWDRARQEGEITAEVIREAEKVAGITFTPDERQQMLGEVREHVESYEALKEVDVPNSVAPALDFDPVLPGAELETEDRPFRMSPQSVGDPPSSVEELAFEPVTRLSRHLRDGEVASEELTRMYLDRLRRHDPRLQCVITLTEDRALEQARKADRELSRGEYRGPLHGVPWGAKDLLAVKGYPTTWGAEPYREQRFDYDASVVRQLDAAGAVLVGKLTLGALASGDEWFGGKTRNPWKPSEGSSGSSAGPAAATAAGLVGFAIGSETLGSIVSPANRCGVTGLRPTFGRVSRHGAMTLSWSQDKLGPLCRTAEDCAVVLDAVEGPDGLDRTVRDVPFNWDGTAGLDGLRLGYYEAAFEEDGEGREFDRRALDTVRSLGVELVPVDLPDAYPIDAMSFQARAEEASAFEPLTRSDRDDLLTHQEEGDWANEFRAAHTIPAVQYLRANRVRRMLMGAMRETFEDVDAFVTPTYGGDVLTATNLTGHPAVVVPSGFESDGTPVSVSFIGDLYADAAALRAAAAFQRATSYHERRPPEFTV